MEHLKDRERGFSINTDAPLDMRFNKHSSLRATDIIATYSGEELEKLFTCYGDFSPTTATYLAKGIVTARDQSPITTTHQLKTLLHQLHCNQKKVAVVFQTLRIETNKELEQLEIFLKNFGEQLTLTGRCAIISYHSIEDRRIKYAFKELVTS
jgi:16S rRNA (cytosine1402-N4)-methyltransferase